MNLNEKEKLYDEQWIKRNLLDLFTNSQVWDDFEVEIQNEMDSLSTSIDKEYLSMVNEIKSWKNLFIDPYNISNKIRVGHLAFKYNLNIDTEYVWSFSDSASILVFEFYNK